MPHLVQCTSAHGIRHVKERISVKMLQKLAQFLHSAASSVSQQLCTVVIRSVGMTVLVAIPAMLPHDIFALQCNQQRCFGQGETNVLTCAPTTSVHRCNVSTWTRMAAKK